MIEEIMAFLRERTRIVLPQTLPLPVCRDPDDHHVLALALSEKVDYLVTGDHDLLVLNKSY